MAFFFETGNNELIVQSFRKDLHTGSKSCNTLYMDYPATIDIRIGVYIEFNEKLNIDSLLPVMENVLLALSETYDDNEGGDDLLKIAMGVSSKKRKTPLTKKSDSSLKKLIE